MEDEPDLTTIFEKRTEFKYIKKHIFDWKQRATSKLKTNRNYSVYEGLPFFQYAALYAKVWLF